MYDSKFDDNTDARIQALRNSLPPNIAATERFYCNPRLTRGLAQDMPLQVINLIRVNR